MWRELRWRRTWLALGALWLFVMLVVCLMPQRPGQSVAGLDKAQHFLSWALVTVWWASLLERRAYAWLAAAMLAFGIGIEFAQDWMALGRQADWRDVVANACGVAGGLVAAAVNRGGWFALVERWLPAT